MYNSLKGQIKYGAFSLVDMQRRIKKMFAMGELNENQLEELLSLTAEKADPEMERPDLLALIQSLFIQMAALSERVKLLEGMNTNDNIDAENTDDYPAWEPWDGLSDQYQRGAIVSHKEQLWESTFQGQNVWEPGIVGSQFWTQYTPEE